MTVEDKMSFVLNDVFKHYPSAYNVEIYDKNHFKVFCNKEEMLETKSTKDVYSHWRDFARDIVMFIINEKIKSALNEV